MGFGLCSLGFLFLLMDSVGLDAVGFFLIAKGFNRAGKELSTYKGYTIAAFAAFAAIFPALLNVYDFASSFGLPHLPKVVVGIKGVCLALPCAVLCFAHCGSTARIAAEGGAKVFALRAKATAYISALYYTALCVFGFAGAAGPLASALIIGKYLIPILNAWLLFTCFTTITTKARAVKEEEIIKNEIEVLERKRALKRKKDGEDEDEA